MQANRPDSINWKKFALISSQCKTISRLNTDLSAYFEAWRQRLLAAHWRIFYPDGVYFEVRHGEQDDWLVLLVVLAVDPTGAKEVVGFQLSAEESKEGYWVELANVRKQGVEGSV